MEGFYGSGLAGGKDGNKVAEYTEIPRGKSSAEATTSQLDVREPVRIVIEPEGKNGVRVTESFKSAAHKAEVSHFDRFPVLVEFLKSRLVDEGELEGDDSEEDGGQQNSERPNERDFAPEQVINSCLLYTSPSPRDA